MPYILIEKTVGAEHRVVSEIEIITTGEMYTKLVAERALLNSIRTYIIKIANKNIRVPEDSEGVRHYEHEACCDTVEHCTRAFFPWVMARELIMDNNKQ
jgi:hypothetical protein